MKHLMLLAAFALLLLSGCQQCGGNRGIFVSEQGELTPQVVLDPAEVQRESPPLYDLLEEARERGLAESWNQDGLASIEDYLGTKGHRLPVYAEYRDKFFQVGYVGC